LAIPEGLDKLKIKNEELRVNGKLDDLELEKFILSIPKKDWEIINNENKTLEDILQISDSILLNSWLRKIRLDIAKKIYDYTSI
jgi:hypothetical protein